MLSTILAFLSDSPEKITKYLGAALQILQHAITKIPKVVDFIVSEVEDSVNFVTELLRENPDPEIIASTKAAEVARITAKTQAVFHGSGSVIPKGWIESIIWAVWELLEHGGKGDWREPIAFGKGYLADPPETADDYHAILTDIMARR